MLPITSAIVRVQAIAWQNGETKLSAHAADTNEYLELVLKPIPTDEDVANLYCRVFPRKDPKFDEVSGVLISPECVMYAYVHIHRRD